MLSLHLYTFLFPFRFLFRFLFRIPHSGFLLFQTPKSTAQFYHLRTRTESRFEETWPVSNSTTPVGTKHHRSINSLPGHLSFCCRCRILHLRHPPPPHPQKEKCSYRYLLVCVCNFLLVDKIVYGFLMIPVSVSVSKVSRSSG